MKINFIRFSLALLIISGLPSCVSRKVYYAKSEKDWQKSNVPDSVKLDYSVFLIGDVGNPDDEKQEPTLKLLQQQIYYADSLSQADTSASRKSAANTSHEKDAVVFMGDNIYEKGMPDSNAADRKEKERRITEQLKVVKNFKGKPIFVPGNHDWNESRRGGLQAVLRQQEFISNYLQRSDVFLPSNGCAGPVELQLDENLVVIVIDSEWWLRKYEKSTAENNDCSTSTKADVINQLKDIIRRNKGKNILITEHHPLFSNGQHGGHFSATDWIFPLTIVRDNLWIPLPIIGSIYPLMREYGISRQDLSNKTYQELRRSMLAAISGEKNVVFASGHEHALQFNRYNDVNFIISGSGSKSSPLVKGNGASFAHGQQGFARLNYYTNGQCWVEFWEPVGDGMKGKVVYRTPLYAIAPKPIAEKKQDIISYKDSVKVLAAGREYRAGKMKRTLLGEHYRNVWATPVKTPYLDLNTFAGGLTPLKMGGGHQTTSLQFQGKDGNLYQFRTVNKDPGQLLPDGLEQSAADDILQDQISSAHPYAALVIPDMAKAIGIYYAAPRLVYVPYSSLLGPYVQQVGGKMGFIEARPDEDLSDFKSFGNAKNAISTDKLYEKLFKDNENKVDQQMFLKCRLFDILIGDWDRHEDQWRWAEFKQGDQTVYKPIPRDRDQAFTKLDGSITKLLMMAVPEPQNFGKQIKDPAKLSLGARDLDRNLLNNLSLNDWIKAANEIKSSLTDRVLENAMKKMPPEVYPLSGPEILSKLKSRRDELVDVAKLYYKTLEKKITIQGSDKREFYTIHFDNDSTQIITRKLNKDNNTEQELFNRKFANKKTKEIDIYERGGKDSVIVNGECLANPIKIRLIGGEGKDFFQDKSKKSNIVVYDDSKNNIKKGENTDVRVTTQNLTKDYDPFNFFNYNEKGFAPDLNVNGDDGIFLGLSHSLTLYKFNKSPYSYKQNVLFRWAPKTNAINFRFTGEVLSLFGANTDLVVGAIYQGPQNTFNYFGEGNSIKYNNSDIISPYRVRTKTVNSIIFVRHRFSNSFQIGIGPGYEYYNILRSEGRYVASPDFSYQDQIVHPSQFITVRSFTNTNFVDNEIFPTTGFTWRNQANYFLETTNNAQQHVQLKTDLTFYATPNFNFPMTFAFRIGGATNIGGYKFFQSNSIGNNYNLSIFGRDISLKGYRDNRFSGRSYLYGNSEVRFPVTTIRNYLFSGTLGITGFFDLGRVYSSVSETDKWHTGYGPGIWVNLFNKIIFSGGYGFSEDGHLFTVKSGMSF
ncbi:BamA/TamA family outer membrane protein [Pedobacter sp. HMF7647]|uniref:BamA/TamA family outer membrane protein n=1 Tax=Hufsiella arboris TaxID=2695275 RepID=A0A7K1YF15_9SPHI|nr:metallophosphoesterase [Hufsiella arboris]MXV53197.1 BamA/TamA family outer membrane protein [Hufsiella arboris]